MNVRAKGVGARGALPTNTTRHVPLPLALLASGLLLLVPLLVRVLRANPLLPGVSSYLQLQATTPYGLLLSSLGSFAILLSIFLGIVSVALVDALALTRQRDIALLLFVVNPLFLTVFTSLSPLAVAIPSVLFALLLERHGRTLLSCLFLVIAAAFAPLIALVALLLLSLRRFETRRFLVTFMGIVLLGLLAGPLPFHRATTAGLISELGSPLGLSFLYLCFCLIEGIVRWDARRGRAEFLLFLVLVAFAPFSDDLRIAAGLFSTVLAAGLVERLFTRRWQLKKARVITLLLLSCLFLFLLLTHLLVLVSAQPTKGLVATLAALPPDDAIVLTSPDLVPLVETIAGHTALSTSCTLACENITQLLHTRNLDEAERILHERNITYLLITEEMHEGHVWNRDDEGLLFLLEHSGRFARIASDKDAVLWRYVPAPTVRG